MNHLKAFILQGGHTDKFNIAYSNAEFLAVGGSTWESIIGNIKGDGLSRYQKHLGNQWFSWCTAGKQVQYLVISMGGNDTDQFGRDIHKLSLRHSELRPVFWKKAQFMLNKEYYRIRKNIDSVLQFLEDEFPGVELLYLKITPRNWWGHHARKLARWLDHYLTAILKGRYRIKEIWLRDIFESHYYFGENPMYGMLKTDMVHFNQFGNTALAQTVMRPLLHKWRALKKCK